MAIGANGASGVNGSIRVFSMEPPPLPPDSAANLSFSACPGKATSILLGELLWMTAVWFLCL
mgnify:CR=1 FL=1